MAKIGKKGNAYAREASPDVLAEDTAKLLRDEAEVETMSHTDEGRDFLLQTVKGTEALINLPVGLDLLANNRIWRLSNLYRFRHIEDARPITLDFDEPYVREIYKGIFSKNNPTLRNIVLKSRQVFVTTLSCAFAIDLCIRTKNMLVGISNYSGDEVKRTIADKLHFCLRNSPYLQIMDVREYADGLYFPSTESRIQASMTGRGRTVGFALITEFAKTSVEDDTKAREVRAGMMAASERSPIIIESSSKGPSGVFYEMCMEAHRLKQSGVRLDRKTFRFHFVSWAQKALNTMEYTPYPIEPYHEYFAKVEKDQQIIITPNQRRWWVSTLNNDFQGSIRAMAEEHPGTVEEAFEVDSEAFVLKDQMRAMRDEGRILPIARNPEYPLIAFWDFGWSDATAVILAQESPGGYVDILYEMKYSGTPLDWFFDQLNAMKQEIRYHVLPGDAYGNNAHVNSKLVPGSTTIANFFRRSGKHNIVRLPKIFKKRSGFEASRQFLASCRINDTCTDLLASLVSVRRQFVRAGNVYIDELEPHQPSNHLYDCLESIARCRLDMKRVFGDGGSPDFLKSDAGYGGADNFDSLIVQA